MFSFFKRDDAEKTSAEKASRLWMKGSRLLARRQPTRAIEAMRAAMEIEPSRLDGRLNFGAALLMADRADEAIPHFRYVLAFDAQNTMALLNLAAAQDKIGDLNGSVQTLANLVEHRPTWKDAHYNLAVALMKQDEFDRASEALKAELRLNPEHALARDLLTDLNLKIPRKKDINS